MMVVRDHLAGSRVSFANLLAHDCDNSRMQ